MHLLEDKFGVTAQAAVVAGPAAGPAAGGEAAAENPLGCRAYRRWRAEDCRHQDCEGGDGSDGKQDLVDGAPKMLKTGLKKEAEALKKQIEEAGGKLP